MTTQTLRLKISTPSLKLKTLPRYPVLLKGGRGIAIDGASGTVTISLDYTQFAALPAFDPTTKEVAVYDPTTGTWNVVLLSTLINNSVGIRIVTEAGDITVGANTQLLVMNRAVDETPSNIILPLAVGKVGRVKIVDFKGNAAAKPHTVKVSGADTFNGALTQWGIAANRASLVFDPIINPNTGAGIGYAV